MHSSELWKNGCKNLEASMGQIPKAATATAKALKSSGLEKLIGSINKGIASADKASESGDLKTLSSLESDINKQRLDFIKAGKTLTDAAGKDAALSKSVSQAISSRISTCTNQLDDLKAEIADARSNLSHSGPEQVGKFVPPEVFKIAAARSATGHDFDNFFVGPLYTVSWADNQTEIGALTAAQKTARAANDYLNKAHVNLVRLQSATKTRKEISDEMRHFFDAADKMLKHHANGHERLAPSAGQGIIREESC